MVWIELHQAVWTHRKTFELAARLDLDDTYAAAHLIRLWCWAVDNAPDGSLANVSDRAVAYGAGWKGCPTTLVDAMIGSGWLDEDRSIHHWEEYAGKLIERRKVDAERQRLIRAEAKKARELREAALRGGSERPADVRSTGPDPTQPNRTGPVTPVVPPLAAAVSAADAVTTTTTTTAVKARGRRGRKRDPDGTTAPAELEPTPAHATVAGELGIDPARLPFEARGFLASNRTWGTVSCDWDALFELWLREAARRGDTGPPPSPRSQPIPPPPFPFAALDQEASAHLGPCGALCEHAPDDDPPAPEPAPTAGEAARIWTAGLGELRLGMSQANYESYLAGTEGRAFEDDELSVMVPNPLVRDTLEARFRQHILRALYDVVGRPCRVRLFGPPPRAPGIDGYGMFALGQGWGSR